jgi:2-phosphoglycerate kinase
MSKQIILIGGMPTAGKSTLAENLSIHLNLPWISTDQVGQIMRGVANREQYPALFTWEDYSRAKSLDELTADEIADNEFANGEANWLGVRKLIKEDYSWNDGFIIEGTHILPHLVAQDFADSSNVNAIFIGDHDAERIRNVVLIRDVPWDKEKEVEWVLKFSEKLKTEVEKHGFAWVEIEKNNNDLQKVLKALKLS